MQAPSRPGSAPDGDLGLVHPDVAALARRLAGLLAEVALGTGGDSAATAIQSTPSRGPDDGSRPAITSTGIDTHRSAGAIDWIAAGATQPGNDH